MKPASVLFLALATASLSAQSGTPNPCVSYGSGAVQTGAGSSGMVGLAGGESTMPPSAVQPVLCPVGLRAQHMADGAMVKTGTPALHKIGQRLYLTLTGKPGQQIVSAKVLVRGRTAKGRVEQAASNAAQNDASQGVRVLTARFTTGKTGAASAKIWAPGLTAVDSVEMLSVSFADGLTWTPGKNQACRVAPDLLMAVSN